MEKLFVSKKEESVRMFESDFLDKFSRVHYTVPLFIFIPMIGYFLYKTILIIPEVGMLNVVGLFTLGIFVWTIFEYTIHRYIFHYSPTSKLGKRIHLISHGVHHDYPNDSTRLVMVPSISLPLAVLVYWSFYPLFGAQLIAPFFTAFVSGYLVYDMIHYSVHNLNFKNKWFQSIKKNHLLHHFKNPSKGYGFTSTYLDDLLGTNFK